MDFILILIVGYIFGSIPFGLILAKLMGHGDIRKIGSGNIGATNALRTGNKKLALLTLLLDMLKGIIPVIIAIYLSPYYRVVAGLGAILGHCFPVWLKFKGGKGVATMIGVMFAISPLLGILVGLTWLAVAFLFKMSSLSSLISSLLAPFYAYILMNSIYNSSLILIITAIIWIRHKDNIIRILNKKEKKIGEK